MKRLIPILFLLVSGVANAEKWLCIEEQSTGFRFNGSEWVVSNFKLRKFLIIKDLISGKMSMLKSSGMMSTMHIRMKMVIIFQHPNKRHHTLT